MVFWLGFLLGLPKRYYIGGSRVVYLFSLFLVIRTPQNHTPLEASEGLAGGSGSSVGPKAVSTLDCQSPQLLYPQKNSVLGNRCIARRT